MKNSKPTVQVTQRDQIVTIKMVIPNVVNDIDFDAITGSCFQFIRSMSQPVKEDK